MDIVYPIVRTRRRAFAFPLFSVKSMQSENKRTKWVERKKKRLRTTNRYCIICRRTNLYAKIKNFLSCREENENEKKKKRKRKFERKCNQPKDPSFYRSTYRASPNFFPSQIYFPATVANIDRKFITDRNHAGTFYYLKFIDIPPEFHRVLQL